MNFPHFLFVWEVVHSHKSPAAAHRATPSQAKVTLVLVWLPGTAATVTGAGKLVVVKRDMGLMAPGKVHT